MALETLEFKDEDESVGPFRRRLFFVFSLVALCFLILACRLAWLQIINRDLYVERAEQNRTVTTTSQGSRGLIFDRNGTLLAGNRLSWSLEVTSSQTAEPVEQLFDRLAEIIPITSADRRRYRRLRENFNRYDSVPIRTDLTDEEVAVSAQRWRFQGLELNQREHRIYPEGAVGSHFLGYVGALSLNDKKRLDAAGDLALYQGEREIGKVGLERSYEKTLHGTPGHEILEVSAGGRPVRTLELEAAQPGSNLTLTIDLNLQRVAEKAMTGKTGSVIAIEPKTGRILAFASLPTYDPNLFPGGIDPESWNYLNTAEEKPLLNRAMRGIYPIGSTYKPFMALAGLELGAVTADYVLNDTGVFQVGNHKFRDVTGSPKGLLSLRKSIAVSSDIYYYWLATQLGVDKIHDFMQQWKFGAKTGIDLVGKQTGILPSRDWKEARFKEPWYVGDTPSLGIGQGYNAFTLLMTPHLVDKIENPVTGESIKVDAEPTGKIPLKDANLDVVIAGMTDVTRTGTARSVFQGAPYSVAGKTGTAQVISIAQDDRWDEKKVSRKHLDHALFIAFAPARNPRIAMAVLVENGGFGARAAAPVAKELMDYWLTGENSLGLPPPKNTPLISMKNAERKKP
ncbi:MAG: penicillin-binding protein 2 [Sutterella sp. 54_7]|nr:MAG: penicillin-binding protein 2 [Sutterella sp. 54_7]